MSEIRKGPSGPEVEVVTPPITSDQVVNDSDATGDTVTDALDFLFSLIGTGAVTSIFGRVGAVVAQINDYAASLIDNDSSVAGATVQDALNTLNASLPSFKFYANWGSVAAPATPTARWFGRNGSVSGATVAASGEYPAPLAGNFTFSLVARVSGTKLTTDSVALEIYKNGVATGVVLTITPADTVVTASGAVTVAVGDGISVRALQTASEAQTAWNCDVSVQAS